MYIQYFRSNGPLNKRGGGLTNGRSGSLRIYVYSNTWRIIVKKIMNVILLQKKIQMYQKADPYMSHNICVYWWLNIDVHAMHLSAYQSMSRNQATLSL